MGYVYVLRSLKGNRKYIGSTVDLKRRLLEHNLGKVKSTKGRRPLVLEAYQVCDSMSEAARLEKQYKRSHDELRRSIEKGLMKKI